MSDTSSSEKDLWSTFRKISLFLHRVSPPFFTAARHPFTWCQKKYVESRWFRWPADFFVVTILFAFTALLHVLAGVLLTIEWGLG